MACPSGQQIRSQRDCDAAFSTIVNKYDYVSESEHTQALLVSRPHFPKDCSVSKGKVYFNTDSTHLTRGDSAVGDTLSFHAVCAPAAYTKVAHAQFCRGDVLYDGGGANASGIFKDLAACQEECDQDARCKFFLWKHEAEPEACDPDPRCNFFKWKHEAEPEECDKDPRCKFFVWKLEAESPNCCEDQNKSSGISWKYRCATFANCDTPEAYSNGKSAVTFRKLDTPAPVKSSNNFTGQGTPHESTPAGSIAKNGVLRFHKLRRGELPSGADGAPEAAPAPAAAAHAAAGIWYACQLVGGHERIVWTENKLVVMTKTMRKDHCAGEDKLHCTFTKFYTGRWSLEGANVLMEWDLLPPMRLSTADGGHNFNIVFGKESQQYSCSSPPSIFTKLIAAAIKEAQLKLAAAQRTNAGVPTDYTEHGCLALVAQPVKEEVFVLARGMTLAKCFTHCAKTKGQHYFAVTRGDSCLCSATPPGNLASPNNCDLRCSGNTEEYCGGFSSYASVYTMIDCLPPGPQEQKEDKAARDARLRAMYSERKSESCGQAKGNEVEVDGSAVFTGYPKECLQACLAGKGAGKCHGFTYNTLLSKCTFHLDVFWGNSTKDPHSSCYFKRSEPLLD